ncbi:uncharacterized protein [Ptychodera flava]|uniref:uncharacterized protein n=1 Tax=Ptychodera flava TaxID=63121 RepID=UPI00396A7937
MPEKLLCCTDNLLLFLVVGVFVALLGLILGILCISVYSMTDSVEYAESAIPSYVPALSLILTGLVVLILFKKRNKLLVSLAVVMTTFSVFLCLCTTVLVTLQVIPFMESFTHCVTHPTTEQCQCYVIDNLPSTVNSTSHIIDVGESEQVTFFGTSSCHVITDTIVDILYTEVVIFAMGGFSCTIAMVFCVLMVCGGHQVNKTETDTIDALSEDHVSISGSMLGSAFSRRILIPGHSYTLGSRQAHNFLRPPYGTYFQEPMETYPFSSEAYPLRDSQGQHTHAEEPPAFGNILMTTAQVQRSEGDSSQVERSEVGSSQVQRSERYRAQVERSSEVDSSQAALTGVSRLTQCRNERRQVQAGENILEADLPNRVRVLEDSDSVDNERSGVSSERNLSGERNTQRRDAHTNETTGGQNLARHHVSRPQQHASLPDYGQFLAGTGE